MALIGLVDREEINGPFDARDIPARWNSVEFIPLQRPPASRFQKVNELPWETNA